MFEDFNQINKCIKSTVSYFFGALIGFLFDSVQILYKNLVKTLIKINKKKKNPINSLLYSDSKNKVVKNYFSFIYI